MDAKTEADCRVIIALMLDRETKRASMTCGDLGRFTPEQTARARELDAEMHAYNDCLRIIADGDWEGLRRVRASEYARWQADRGIISGSDREETERWRSRPFPMT